MHTLFDWLTMGLFCALVMLFLQRSAGAPVPGDRGFKYLPAAIGCAGADWLGNAGWTVAASLLLAASMGYGLLVLKP